MVGFVFGGGLWIDKLMDNKPGLSYTAALAPVYAGVTLYVLVHALTLVLPLRWSEVALASMLACVAGSCC